MRFEARVVGEGPPPPGDRLFLHDTDYRDADFSGQKLDELSIANATFRRCRFERMRVRVTGLGVLGYPAHFVECSFDGSRLGPPVDGSARFERCTFRNVDIRGWNSDTVEMIDCVFTGKLRDGVFQGRILRPADQDKLGRTTNEFRGNDFSGLTLCDVGFRAGIDLSRQVLPGGEDYLYLPDAAHAIERVRPEVDRLAGPLERDAGRDMLASLSRDVAAGQRQLLLRVSLYQRYRLGVGPAVLDLLRAAA